MSGNEIAEEELKPDSMVARAGTELIRMLNTGEENKERRQTAEALGRLGLGVARIKSDDQNAAAERDVKIAIAEQLRGVNNTATRTAEPAPARVVPTLPADTPAETTIIPTETSHDSASPTYEEIMAVDVDD